MFKLNTDFKDYYDGCLSEDNSVVYNRLSKQVMSRGEALHYLNNNGIKTVKFGPVSKFIGQSHIVVYTNPMLHNFLGKHIYSYNEANGQYRNCLASEFLINSKGCTVKYLQVGERRFRMMFQNDEYKTKLMEGKLVALDELPRQYNYAIGLPIYSIDYVSNGGEMVAVDFNEVQQLDRIGFQSVMNAEDVADEIKRALVAYNKA